MNSQTKKGAGPGAGGRSATPPPAIGHFLRRPAGKWIAGGLTILLLALFIFSSTNGDITVQGDDVLFMTHAARNNWNYFHEARWRAFLTPFYTLIYWINGENTRRTHLFDFALLVLSALLLYIVLTKILGAAPAIMAAMFYLAYTGKHETVTWMSAAAYLIAANVLFLSIWVAISDWFGAWTKAALIAFLNFFNVLFCEILIVVAPLYPLFYWLHCRLSGRRVQPRALAATFLPLLMFLFHVTVIYVTTPKDALLLWQRGTKRPNMSQGSYVLSQLWSAFQKTFTSAVGTDHYSLLQQGIGTFRTHVPHTIAMELELLGVGAGVLLLLWVSPVIRFEKAIVVPLGIAGIYLLLFSALPGFGTITTLMPSRLLTLPGIGLALLAGVAVSWGLSWQVPLARYAIPAIVLAATMIEAASMNSILYEHQTSWHYDQRIRTQLLASGIHQQEGDTIFISLPDPPQESFWRTGFSQFDRGHIQTVLQMDFKVPTWFDFKPLLYVPGVRRKGVPPVVPKGQPGYRLFCLSVSDDLVLTRTDCPRP